MSRDILGVGAVIAGLIAAVVLLARKKPPPSGRVPPCDGIGDPDMDGYVTDADIALLEQFIMGTITPTAEEFRRADVNGDGLLNALDMTLMERYIAGLDDTFPACTVVTEPILIGAYVFCPYEFSGSWSGSLDAEAADPDFWGAHQGGIIASAPVGTKVALWVLLANYGDAWGEREVWCRLGQGIHKLTVGLDPGYATWVVYQVGSSTPRVMDIWIDYEGPAEIITTFPFV